MYVSELSQSGEEGRKWLSTARCGGVVSPLLHSGSGDLDEKREVDGNAPQFLLEEL